MFIKPIETPAFDMGSVGPFHWQITEDTDEFGNDAWALKIDLGEWNEFTKVYPVGTYDWTIRNELRDWIITKLQEWDDEVEEIFFKD